MRWVAEEEAIKIPYKPEGGCIRFYYGPVPVGMTETEGLGVIEYKPGEFVEAGAEVFMAETGPEDVIEPHFHRVDQFQIVVNGSGTIGKEPVQPVGLHYTDGYTPYGPIVAGPEGLAFFTIRAKGEPNVYYMPQSREELVRKAGRAITCDVDLAVAGEGALNQEVAREPLIEPQEDGLAAFLVRARPGAPVAGAVAQDTAGQCHLLVCWVLDGKQSLHSRSGVRQTDAFLVMEDRPTARVAAPPGVRARTVAWANRARISQGRASTSHNPRRRYRWNRNRHS